MNAINKNLCLLYTAQPGKYVNMYLMTEYEPNLSPVASATTNTSIIIIINVLMVVGSFAIITAITLAMCYTFSRNKNIGDGNDVHIDEINIPVASDSTVRSTRQKSKSTINATRNKQKKPHVRRKIQRRHRGFGDNT